MSHQDTTLISSLNLLTYPVSSTYFTMKQHDAHYASLKSVDTRRGQHSELIDVCLLTLEKTIHGGWAGWPISHACHTAENEKTRKRAG